MSPELRRASGSAREPLKHPLGVRVSQDRNRDASSSAPIPNVTAMIAAALSASVSLRTGRTSTPTASPTGAAVATIAVVDAKGTRPRHNSRCSTPDGVVLGPSATCSSSGPRSAAWHAPHPAPRPARRSAALPGQPSQIPGRRPATSTTRHRPAAPDATPTSSAHERRGPPPPQRSHPKRPSEPILAEPPTAVTARTHEPRRRRARV